MNKYIAAIICLSFSVSISFAKNIQFTPVKLCREEILYLKKELEPKNAQYDKKAKMLFSVTRDRHYHSDLDSGVVVHQTRESLEYAVALLKTGDSLYMRRGLDIVKTILPMQEKDPRYPFCGIWPYYPEDPLRGRKAPVDYNWADFIAVPLIDIIINHSDYVGKEVCAEIKEALILASKAIVKRDVQPDYTNICIMGTYVCYVVGDIYKIKKIEQYARKRLKNFYEYTLRNKGFTEYNSPTYTLVAMDELLRMRQCVANPDDRKIVNDLYAMCWDVIARHYHQPSGQWCGPNLRSYSNLATPQHYKLFYNASGGVIDLPGDYPRIPNVTTPHKIPADILPKFTHQTLPRVETDTFVVCNPDIRIKKTTANNKIVDIQPKSIIGKLYASPVFALASVNQGYMWDQTRPLIAHWGTPAKPSYMRVRFLHDLYDFSAVNIFSVQDSTTVLSIFNVAKDGGDRHPNIDRMKDASITASDLRLRIEAGGDLTNAGFVLSDTNSEEVRFSTRNMSCVAKVPYDRWGDLSGRWVLGNDGKTIYADFVIYSGENRIFDFNEINEAVLGLYLSMSVNDDIKANHDVKTSLNNGYLQLSQGHLSVQASSRPDNELIIKNDYEITD